jgi:hypothetical protein
MPQAVPEAAFRHGDLDGWIVVISNEAREIVRGTDPAAKGGRMGRVPLAP